MTVTPTTAPPKRGHKTNGLDNQAFVQIAVRGKKLHLYPQRGTDTVIFARGNSSANWPARPREVRWVVTGLDSGQTVRIEARTELGLLEADVYEISFDANTVTSGPASHGAGGQRELRWKYDLILLQDGTEQDRIDPIIIIKDDP